MRKIEGRENYGFIYILMHQIKHNHARMRCTKLHTSLKVRSSGRPQITRNKEKKTVCLMI